MVVVDLTMHPVNDASLTPNPNPFSLAGGTHTTARVAAVTVDSDSGGNDELGVAGVRAGIRAGSGSDKHELKTIIYGILPEKKDALGETGDANANIVGMKLNFTVSAADTIKHYAVSEFDVRLDGGHQGTNGYQGTDVVRICYNGIDHDDSSTASTVPYYKASTPTGSPRTLNADNYGNIEAAGGPILGLSLIHI